LPTVPLPNNPSVEQLRTQAKAVRDLAGAGVQGALDLVGAHHPDGPHAVTLTGAQLVVARHYGFSSWARLTRHVEMIERYRRDPDEVEDASDPVDAFLALACLRYGDDDPSRWSRAAAILDAHPAARAHPLVAAAACDVEALGAALATDATAAVREGGPYRWPPILYLTYARHDPRITDERALAAARLLLDHGADANSGYLWHGLYPPFTALAGALGSGSPEHPEHPCGFALAWLLLERGADPNDGQLLYNRQFSRDDRHLVVLLAAGLGRGDGGPWARRFGHTADTPAEMLRGQLWWAIVHDWPERARLLVDHGVDIRSPYAAPGGRPFGLRTSDGRTPAEVAALAGCPELAAWLVERGAPPPHLEGPDALIAAALAGDAARVEDLRRYAAEARERRPGLIVWAASRRRLGAIPLLVDLGFDVNAYGRSDIPAEQSWETALHAAAGEGDAELAELLLGLGADPHLEDHRFHSTPLGWARHFAQPATIALLEPLTE